MNRYYRTSLVEQSGVRTIAGGGTGANSASQALDNLNAYDKDYIDNIVGNLEVAGAALQTAVNGKAATNLVGSPVEYIVACSSETAALAAGVAKVTFRAPVAFRLAGVSASVTVASTMTAIVVDINNGANSVLSTKLSIDANEKTSATAATAAVINVSFRDFTQDAVITIDIDQAGTTAGAGLKVILRGTRL